MDNDDTFEPRLGRIRSVGRGKGRAYLARILAAANLARGSGPLRPSRSSSGGGGGGGGRSARGAGTGRMLRARDMHAAFRGRRVVVKARIVRLAGKGAAGAAAHLRYLQRDGVTRDGEKGRLYDAHGDSLDAREFMARGKGDRHQFRLIVAPEDGAQYEELKPLVRRLMGRMEEDLGTTLEWAAVDHYNTGHPHAHIVLRGIDERGRDLVVARDYLTHGIRERAAELVAIDLGPRSDREIETTRRAEIRQERLTSIDRALLRDSTGGLVEQTGRNAFEQSLRTGRLRHLASLGLAEQERDGRWWLDPDLEATLRRMGERGDIVRTMQRALAATGLERAPSQWSIESASPDIAPLVGRVVARGLADEHADRHHLIVDGIDGRLHHVAIGDGTSVAPLPEGSIVRIERRTASLREADRTIAAVAAASNGIYSVDAHLLTDPTASEAYAETHIRRLEAIRRMVGGIERSEDGTWAIGADYPARAVAYELKRLERAPVAVEVLSPLPLEKLVEAEAATWLDREVNAKVALAVSDSGFGTEVSEAQQRRRRWLIAQRLIDADPAEGPYPSRVLATLQRRELARAGAALSRELGLPFAEMQIGDRVEGIYRRPVDLAGGRFALVERAHEFTLVPWRPVLEPRLGKQISGLVRQGGIGWTFGRGRSGPTIG